MSRLIVISNRVSTGGGAQGGLAVALSAALREHGGVWFGWSGNETAEFTGHINFQREDSVTTATMTTMVCAAGASSKMKLERTMR